jgi:hypothetical protein
MPWNLMIRRSENTLSSTLGAGQVALGTDRAQFLSQPFPLTQGARHERATRVWGSVPGLTSACCARHMGLGVGNAREVYRACCFWFWVKLGYEGNMFWLCFKLAQLVVEMYLSPWYMVRFPRKAKTPLERGVKKIERWQCQERRRLGLLHICS